MALGLAAPLAGAALLVAALGQSAAQQRLENPKSEDRRTGTFFLTPALQAQQRDDGANPGMLWVESGRRLWSTPPRNGGPACMGCHGSAEDSMRGVATRYPKIDAATGKLQNLELRINACRTGQQMAPAFAYESQELLALTSYVVHQSRGLPISVETDGAAAPFLEEGRAFYTSRQGQLNLACTQCHDENWGRRLRGDVISQGHPTGFPAYRLEWQGVGSLHRRLRACSQGIRAEVYEYGSNEYLALELYLASRARGLPIETPALRR